MGTYQCGSAMVIAMVSNSKVTETLRGVAMDRIEEVQQIWSLIWSGHQSAAIWSSIRQMFVSNSITRRRGSYISEVNKQAWLVELSAADSTTADEVGASVYLFQQYIAYQHY